MNVEPQGGDGEPKEYEFKNNKKLKISKSMPAIAINIDDKKPSNKVKKFPEMPAGQSMDKEDVAPDTPEPEPCTNF